MEDTLGQGKSLFSHRCWQDVYLEHDHLVECPGLNRTVVADLFVILASNMNNIAKQIMRQSGQFKSMHYTAGLSGNQTMLFFFFACSTYLPGANVFYPLSEWPP